MRRRPILEIHLNISVPESDNDFLRAGLNLGHSKVSHDKVVAICHDPEFLAARE
jgi:hypothetical protein